MTTAVAVTPRSMRHTPGAHLEILERADVEVRWPEADRQLDEREMIALVRGCEGLLVGIDPVTEAVLTEGPLRAVVKYGSGMDNVDIEAAARLGTKVASTPGANSRSVAELTIALLFALARHVTEHDRGVRSGSWARWTGVELRGKRLGVVGLGTIGREVAAMARALGLEVCAHDPHVAEADLDLVALHELLETSDAVSLHVPLDEATRGMIGAEELESMRQGALLVNTARGGLVDEEALAAALASRRLGGAAMDGFVTEPPLGSALLELDNFIASPHAGAATTDAIERTGVAAARALLRLLGKDGGGPR